MHKRISTLAASVVALALALPGVASAGTLVVSRPCYTHFPATAATVKTQPIVVAVSGGTPGADFQVRAGNPIANGGLGSVIGTFNTAGVGVAAITNVFPGSGSIDPLRGDRVVLAVHDFGTGTDIAAGSTLITNAAISVARKPTNPYSKRVIRVSGLTPVFGGGTLYGSYVSGYKGKKVIKRVKLGKPNACGYLKFKRELPPRRGTHKWTLYVHVGPSLHRAQSLKFPFKVFKRFL